MTTYVERLALGPADGMPVAVKDTIDIKGRPTRAGCPALADAPPAEEHAEAVARMLAAGARITGKTVLHELAFGVSGINDHAGTALNAQFPALIPGGSSSGSAAAVAEGSARVALGTDTGGSVRIPAACCGVWGMKPSFGLVSRRGVMPPESSLDCVGPFAATLADLQWAMSVLAPGFAPQRIGSARIGWIAGQAEPAIEAALRAALDRPEITVAEVALTQLGAAFEAGLTVINAENWAALGPLLATGLVSPDVAGRIRAGAELTPADLAAAEAVRAAATAEIDAALASVDLLALPTLAAPPPSLELARRDPSAVAVTRNVRAFNLIGHPALAVPMGSLAGAPLSLQLVGPKGGDALVCAAAALITG
ncbi:amidase [Poseidonocella sp. HB161398]|uniref:amidase n=1 Tax=Poseidonocella sp. HB161398 TaxID=2320855 RepID=UPI001107E5BD|nr:amidase [Poseidonocella sp. HB161398]